eukprot:6895014-Pyramimonas_sp.AAC.1
MPLATRKKWLTCLPNGRLARDIVNKSRSWAQMAQDGRQDGPRGSKMAPSPPKKPPRWPKTAQGSPRAVQDGPRGLQE